ncbi:MAG: beta-N-acetylhexosaminidase [Bacteroidetes bacterium]|nr:beta-N-acetylhexosaminidase [Bacteroidota bacterium]
MKKIITIFCTFFAFYATAQEVSIIPQPSKITFPEKGEFVLSSSTVIVANKKEQNSINFLNDYLQKFYGFKLKQVTKATSNFINLTTPVFVRKPDNEEAYTLIVNKSSIHIQGSSLNGTFYGVQSLLQLLPTTKNNKLSIPFISIEDAPRFAYRGMHLDVSRHFFPVDYIKKYIDFIALHKMNTFHWHLTDDQGWRIEIKKYPKLTQVGGFRNGTIIGRYPGKGNDGEYYGGYYTQEQIKEVVQYAANRFITVIPEIEMPGHSSAAIAAYPELSCFPNEPTKHNPRTAWHGDSTTKQVQQAWGVFEDVYAPTEYTFNFLENVLNEVMQLFPSKYIHVGGDECPKESWKRSAFCQQLIKEKGLKDEHGLQSYFIQRIEKYLNTKGRQIIGWDEILEGGLAPNATVMSWRGEQGGIEAAKQKHNVIMTPGGWCYFDHSQTQKEDSVTIGGFTSLEKVYSYDPVPKELNNENKKYVLGAQANVWTEYIGSISKLEYMIFPRMSALSEVLWTPSEQKNEADFKRRIEIQKIRYNMWEVNYFEKK